MDLEARLRAFAAFARRRSFSAAARELRISQPAVSKHIAELEREAGVKLVVRRPRGGDLTPAGEFLANHVLRAHALLAQAARGVGEFRQQVTGSLTVVASGVPATYLLPEVVVAFRRAHPGVRVSIVQGNSAQTMDALRSHRAELGVVGGFAAAPEIEAEPLVEEEVLVIWPSPAGGPLDVAPGCRSGDMDLALQGIRHSGGRRGRLGGHQHQSKSTPGAAQLGSREAGGRSRPWRGRLQRVHRGGRAPRRFPWRRSAARLEGAPDDLDRPPSRSRAHSVGARIRDDDSCPMAPPVGIATPRQLVAITMTARRSDGT